MSEKELDSLNLRSSTSVDDTSCIENDYSESSSVSQLQVKELFLKLDENKSGFIERGELSSAIPSAETDTIDFLISKLDVDGDGKISFQELKTGFHSFLNSLAGDNHLTGMDFSSSSNMDTRRVPASRVDLTGMTKLEEYLSQACAAEDIYQTSRRCSTRELFSSLESCNEAAQIYQYLLQHEPQMLQKFYRFVEETLKHIKEQHKAKDEMEVAFAQEQKKQKLRMADIEEEAENMAKHIEQRTAQKMEEKFKEEKLELQSKIARLNEELENMQISEYELKQKAQLEVKAVKDQLHTVDKRNKTLAQEKREVDTQLMIVKTQLATCKQEMQTLSTSYQENDWMSEYMTELSLLTDQVDQLQVINKQLNETNNSLNEELNDIKGKIHSDQGQSPTSNTFSSTQSIQLPKAFERTGPKYPGISLCEELEQASLASSTEYGTADGRLHTDGRQHTAHHNNANEQHHIFQPRKGTLTENLTRPFLVETQSLEGVDELTDNPRISNRRRSHKSDMYHDSTDTLLSISSTFTDYAPQRLYKVIFVGDAGVGKTSFVTHFCKGYFQLNTAATLGIDFYTKNIEVDRIKITLQLWDTAGQERFRCISTPYFRKVDGVVLMYDCCTESSFLSVREWIEIIRSNSDMDDLPIMICANKIDLRGEKEELGFKVISSEMGEQLANECKTMFSELSAKTGEQLNSCIHRLGRIMKEREDEGIKRYEHGLQIGSFKEGKKKCCNG